MTIQRKILDGYNRIHKLNGLKFQYRPMLRHERLDWANTCFVVESGNWADIMLNRIVCGKLQKTKEFLDAVLGINPYFDEEADAENLREGVRLLLEYPRMEDVSCQDCKTWWMDPRTGECSMRGGVKQKRPDYAMLLCEVQGGEGCPKGHHSNPKELSPKNSQALRHFFDCHATNTFPDDEIVKRNARIIKEEFRRAKRSL